MVAILQILRLFVWLLQWTLSVLRRTRGALWMPTWGTAQRGNVRSSGEWFESDRTIEHVSGAFLWNHKWYEQRKPKGNYYRKKKFILQA